MPRKRRPLDRTSAVRDAKLIIIATEDTKATVRYFEALVSSRYYQNLKVQVRVLQRESTASSPEHILAMLDTYRNEYPLDANDELWLVIDVDKWGDKKLSQVAAQSEQKGFLLAISNPAIELWFLLHLTSLDRYDEATKADLLKNEKVRKNRTRLDQAIVDIIGSYNKSNLDVDHFLPHLSEAVERAKALDTQPQDRWPQQLGTHVYRLVRSILDSRPYQ